MAKNVESKQKKRAQWAWYLYDFGNSAYAAVVLLAVYSAGLAIPFIIISFFINSILGIMKRTTRFIGALNKASGILLIIIGLLLIFDKFRLLANL